MRIQFDKYPIDIIICMIWSIILFPVVLLDSSGIIQIILGLPTILFIPGYILVTALFPTKENYGGLDVIERIAFSFGFSIAIVSLLGFGLNYTPWGIRLEPIILSLFLFINGGGIFALYRWINIEPKKRYVVSLDLSVQRFENKLDKALTVILVVSMIIIFVSLIYIFITPTKGENFTGFFILNPVGKTDNYTKNLSVGENTSVVMGITNHEYQTLNYTIEVWLINQSVYFDESLNMNRTFLNHMWFFDKIKIKLNHKPLTVGGSWEAQWVYNYSFNVNREGYFKLVFLLFITPTEEYIDDQDYVGIAEQKIMDAYREVHLWINVI